MTVEGHHTHRTQEASDIAVVWQLAGYAAQALERVAGVLDDIGQGLPPAEQALAYQAAVDAVRDAWDAIAAIRDRI